MIGMLVVPAGLAGSLAFTSMSNMRVNEKQGQVIASQSDAMTAQERAIASLKSQIAAQENQGMRHSRLLSP
ncbi:hypothetical protein [Methylobacterium brachiatum]|uniref:hypothetical protein n=1 Tax=Methylobacterium brachiatum TaxID=269660 RepID=UPI000EFCBE60|nr:hypothetical protein [Methylobacterium brachiatum]AYO83553.1 hypothetical protein EBB05_15615 [Methylobacterium brachiatum]